MEDDRMAAKAVPMIVIDKIIQTCGACPSQWSARTIDGKYVYIRFRWGYLRIDVDGQHVFGKCVGEDSMNGLMDESELKIETEGVLDFSKAQWVDEAFAVEQEWAF